MKKTYYPMLAKDATDQVFSSEGGFYITSKNIENPDYLAEIKYDGSRYILQWDAEGKAFLTSRNSSKKTGLPVDKTEQLRGYLFEDNKDLAGWTLDGEILVMQRNKKTDKFEMPTDNGSSEVTKIMGAGPEKAQERLQDPDTVLMYMVYDCISSRGIDIETEPLFYRKKVVDKFFSEYGKKFKYMEKSMVFKPTQKLLDRVLKANREGLMLKLKDSPYEQEKHSKYWLKVKRLISEDAVVLGVNRGTGKYTDTMGALVVGQFFEFKEDEIDGMTIKELIKQTKEDRKEFTFSVVKMDKVVLYIDKNEKVWELREVAKISGMTDAERNTYWNRMKQGVKDGLAFQTDTGIYFNPLFIRNSDWIVEFSAQEKTKARYRHPRYLQDRKDKDFLDCTF